MDRSNPWEGHGHRYYSHQSAGPGSLDWIVAYIGFWLNAFGYLFYAIWKLIESQKTVIIGLAGFYFIISRLAERYLTPRSEYEKYKTSTMIQWKPNDTNIDSCYISANPHQVRNNYQGRGRILNYYYRDRERTSNFFQDRTQDRTSNSFDRDPDKTSMQVLHTRNRTWGSSSTSSTGQLGIGIHRSRSGTPQQNYYYCSDGTAIPYPNTNSPYNNDYQRPIVPTRPRAIDPRTSVGPKEITFGGNNVTRAAMAAPPRTLSPPDRKVQFRTFYQGPASSGDRT